MARRALQQDVNTSRDLPSEDPCDHDGLSLYNLYDIRNMYLFLYKFVYFSVYAPCVYWCPQKPEKASGYRELELQVAVKTARCGFREPNKGFCKSSRGS